MSFSVGFPNAAAVTIGGQSAATLKALNEASTEAADEALEETQTPGKVRTGAGAGATDQAQESGSTQSIAVQVLLKRMQELQQQLRSSSNNWPLHRPATIRRRKPRPRRSWRSRDRSPTPVARCWRSPAVWSRSWQRASVRVRWSIRRPELRRCGSNRNVDKSPKPYHSSLHANVCAAFRALICSQ